MGSFERIQNDILLLDGALDTKLLQSDAAVNCKEMLNLTRPVDILDLHTSYIEAGADIIRANTASASRIRLNSLSVSAPADEIINSGIALCKEAAQGTKTLVAASIGPTGVDWRRGEHMPQIIYEAFCEQCLCSSLAGADILFIEAMEDLFEARLALLAASACSGLPVYCGFKLNSDGKTKSGNPTEVLSLVSNRLGAKMCGLTNIDFTRELFTYYSRLSAASSLHSFIAPNFILENGEAIKPEEIAESVLPYLHCGAKLIGGSDNASAAHILALRKLLNEYAGNAGRAVVSDEYICSSVNRFPLSLQEDIEIIKLGGLNLSQAKNAILQKHTAHTLLHIDFADWSGEEVRSLVYNVLTCAADITLAFHVYSAGQAEQALFMYPGIAPVYAHADAYRVSELAAKYAAELMS